MLDDWGHHRSFAKCEVLGGHFLPCNTVTRVKIDRHGHWSSQSQVFKAIIIHHHHHRIIASPHHHHHHHLYPQ
jgi:hypothetical protein